MTPNALHRWGALAAAVAALSCAVPCRANDSSTGVPLPGLMSQPRGSVRSAVSELNVDGNAVVLRLQLQVSAAGRKLALRGPRFAWLGEADPYPDRHFPELRAQLNGVAISPSTAFAAFAGGRDITADLTALGLDPFVIASTPPMLDPLPDQKLSAFKRLLAQRAVAVTEGQTWARWQAQRLWSFPTAQPGADAGAGVPPAFELSYKARPGFALVPLDTLAKALPLASYCISAEQIRAKLAEWGQTGGPVVAKSYAIATGVDGHAPKRLMVHVAEPRAVFCSAGGKPVFGGPAAAMARTDGAGILRILRLDKPG